MPIGQSIMSDAKKMLQVQRVKRLVRDRLGAGSACIVSVKEVYCEDPGCTGLATNIRIISLDFRETRIMVRRPLAEVTAADVAQVFGRDPQS